MATGEDYDASGGGVYANGKYYYVSYMSFMGYVIADLNVCDFDTWTLEESIPVETGAVSRDMTYDPVTGNVYGCFFNDDADGWVFGRLSLETGVREVLSELETVFVTIAANSKGEVYGIDLFGDLYSFDKQTGAKTKIGSTGRTPAYSASGCFDLRTDKFYWECLETDAVARIFEVNTSDASVSLVTTLPNSSEMVAMFIPTPEAEDAAPAAVDDLSLIFEGASLSGNVSFSLPVSTFDGNSLAGLLDYDLTLNEQSISSGKAEAGATLTIPVSVDAPGQYRFAVTVSNSVGNSPVAKVEAWIGDDVPNAVRNLTIAKGTSANSIVLTWSPVTGSVHNGYVNAEEITYRVVRQPGDVLVADNLKETTFTEELPADAELTTYTYDVYAVNDGVVSDVATSKAMSIGIASLPFSETFDTNGIDLFYVVDADNDGYTWTYDPTWDAARIRYSSANNYTQPKNDWLFCPLVSMKSDRLYYFEFKARCYMTAEPERVEVKLGNAQSVDAMTQEVFPVTVIGNDTYETFSTYVTVPEDGVYSFGIHACSLADKMYLYVDDVNIAAGPRLGSPDAVSNLKAVAGVDGALTATISFNAPTKTVDGAALSSISGIDIYRNGRLIKTLDSPAVGASLSYEDTNAAQGNNIYTVVAENDKGAGHTTDITVFVGHDIPGLVSNVKAVDNNGVVTITWEAPTRGANGGYFDASALTYIVQRANDSATIAKNTSSLVAVDINPPLDYQQDFFAYYVYAVSPAGVGDGLMSNIVAVGEPFAMPFKESFPNCTLTNDPWDVEVPDDSEGQWSIVAEGSYPTVDAQDNDGGLVTFITSEGGDSGTLYSGKIDFTTANTPVLQYYYYYVSGSRDYITTYISADGGDFEKVDVLSYYAQNCEDGWILRSIDLTKFSSAKYIQLAFEAESSDAEYNIHMDNIRVRNLFDYNLSLAALSVPERVKVGTPFNAVVTVENSGLVPTSKYTVNFLVNGEVIASQDGVSVQKDSTVDFTFEVTPTVHFGSEASLSAAIEWAKDEDQSDNVSDVKLVTVTQPNYPAVDDLSATVDDGSVELMWNEPLAAGGDGKPVVDGAEAYKAFAITNIGEWTMIDRDKTTTYGISDGNSALSYDNLGAAMAFMIFNPAQAGLDKDDDNWGTYAGNQMFASFAAIATQNDDWMISPELPGISQEISFFVKTAVDTWGLEQYEVYYSTSGDDVSDFIKIGSTREAPNAWTEVKVVLPADAKHFAIRCVSNDCFAFLVDNITYIPATAFSEELSLIGYNVYCNKVKLNDEPIEELSYIDQLTDSSARDYYVTVVYDKGESPISNIVTVNPSGVADAEMAAVKVVAEHGAIRVLGADGQHVAVFAVDGKVLAGKSNASGNLRFAVPNNAVYVVTVGNKAYRLIVK